MDRFKVLVQRASGMDTASIGPGAMERAVQRRMRICECETVQAYWAYLSTSQGEFQQLLESVLVPETWFFRDLHAFVALGQCAAELHARAPMRMLRLLSVPCSTGEEPYSMAMTLLDAGVPARSFRVDAVDISQRELSRAQAGVYGRNSFRAEQQIPSSRYFEERRDGYVVKPEIRQQVRFTQGNLLDPEFGQNRPLYDIVFCRNLLIYFDVPTQDVAIQTLGRLLPEAGWIFAGSSETPLFLRHGFESARIPRAFAFRKNAAARRTPSLGTVPTTAGDYVIPFHTQRRHLVPLVPLSKPPTAVVSERRESLLETATRLADDGRLDEAGELCERHIRECGESAQALYLLGLVRDAGADPQRARECYRMALYLDPDHYGALVHLALLKEQEGNFPAAATLKDRAKRVQERSPANPDQNWQ